jgi:hypothetical protein
MAFLSGKRGAALVVAAALLLPALAALAQNPGREYPLKAVFLYNFCRFIEWPARAFATPDEPLVIAVIGDAPFGPLLEETVRGERVRGRTIRIERYRRASEIRRCHILFVAASETSRTDEILAAVAGQYVVTVGETEAFLDRGGMIALVADQNRIRLLINRGRLRASGLTASSKLLQVAEIRP